MPCSQTRIVSDYNAFGVSMTVEQNQENNTGQGHAPCFCTVFEAQYLKIGLSQTLSNYTVE